MGANRTAHTDDRKMLTEGLASFVWFRLALVLVPASQALGWSHPGLVRLMRGTLRDIKADVGAYVAEYDVRKREDDE